MTKNQRPPRVVIASRIFTPEPAAASYFLENCALAFRDAGWDVRVLTTHYSDATYSENPLGVKVFRAPIFRNAAGYARGYFSYLSFDVPLLFRLLFMRPADLIFVEPPPTTGAIVRIVSWLRRIPYVYDAADIWSDAAVTTTTSRVVLRSLLAAERFAIRGALHAFVVAPAYADRLRALGIHTPTTVSGFGVDAKTFDFREPGQTNAPYFVYGGSYSEWHGADIFITAFAKFSRRHPGSRLLYIGNGSERPSLEALTVKLGLTSKVEFRDSVPGTELAYILSTATASLASLKPGLGYDFAFATKIYSSLATGCPVVFTGAGPTGPFINEASKSVAAGLAVDYDVDDVDQAMEHLATIPANLSERRRLSDWTRSHHSLLSVGERIVKGATTALGQRR